MDPQAHMAHDSLVPSTEAATPSVPSISPSGSPDLSTLRKGSTPDHLKFTSPAPPTASSLTPPPSSQIPNSRSAVRTPTPNTPHLSSPPPTVKMATQASGLAESTKALFSPEQINGAPADELRSMVNELTVALRDVRLSAAHYKLQYNMAVIESREAAERMAVELTMAQREVDVLQQAEERRRNAATSPPQSYQEPPVNPANAILLNEMNRQCQGLQLENEELRDLLDQQKRITEHREGELASLMEENDRLKTRIRKNRDHIAPFLPYLDQVNDHGSPRSLFGTPMQPTPRNRAQRVPPPLTAESSRGQHNFETLLLADKILSQETATAPSTPTRSQAPKPWFGHNRGTHSMSSLPQTPNRLRGPPLQRPDVPRTPPTFSAVSIPQSAPPAHYQHKPSHIRRESSNSTITASSVDEEEAFTDREDGNVLESSASQLATSMLRKSTQSSKHMSAPSTQGSHNLTQSKLYGHVKKTGVSRPEHFEKRRLQSGEHHGSPTKRNRVDHSVGLGIGGLRD